ncbi:MAG: diguanylate cyclase [Rhodocyclaceae bacterium]|nr:diguanylate cyclase [Rhodocyclaceae bacterium]
MSRVAHIVWTKLTGLMPGELNRSELVWLLSPHAHFSLLARRRATMIVNRVRLFAFLFAVLTPLWTFIDYFAFPYPLWASLAALRIAASIAFGLIVIGYRPSGSLPDAYRAMALLFAVPTIFYVASHQLLSGHQLAGLSAAIATGYAFLPFVLLAGLAIFPLTFIENILIASPILFAQALSGYMRWSTLDWPSFAGAFWLLTLITGVSNLAGMSQLAFMIALVRQAIRDPLTGSFSRRSGEETLEMQFTLARRSNAPLAVAFVDLDHFKSVNDGFGHEAGDQVLTEAAARITNNLRRGDMLVRWGGEEFVLVLPNTDIGQARDVLARLRQRGFGKRPDGSPVTASIGIAERNQENVEDWRQLVEVADRRMYLAKTGGRDRIVHACPGECPAPQPTV